MKKALKLASNMVLAVMIVVVVALVLFVVKGKIDGDGVPRLAGLQVYVVLSGSMSPVFDTGSVVAVKPVSPGGLREGDIITFKDPEEAGRIITHRILEVREGGGGRSFVTMGDANNAPDARPVPEENVIGRMELSVPYAGYLLDFAKSKKGLLFLIVIPGAIFIVSELFHLYRLVQQAEEEEKREKEEAALADMAAPEAGNRQTV